SAAYAPVHANINAATPISFLIMVIPLLARGSVGMERHAVRDRFESPQTAPDGHQEEKAQIDQRPDLRHEVVHVVGRLRAQKAQYQEVDDENAIEPLVPRRTVTDRFDRGVIQPRQEEQDDDGATHGNDTPEFGVDGAQED